MERYYKVNAKCGHVGKNNYCIKCFGVKARNGKEAAGKIRNAGRVKHDQKGAIIDVIEITREEYREICRINSTDPYFHSRSIQEYRRLSKDIHLEVFREEIRERMYDPEERRQRVLYLKKKYKELEMSKTMM